MVPDEVPEGSNKGISMRTVAVVGMVALWALAGSALAAGDAAAGKAKSAVCTACHGADGNSTMPDWPKLAGQNARYLVSQIKAFKEGKTRNNPMMAPMVANLSDQDMADLAAYYASQPRTGGYASEERAAAGAKLYRGGNASTGVPACMACHAPNGAGNGPAGFPALSGQHAKYTATQLKAYRAGERTSDLNAMMRGLSAGLTDEEIEAVAEYLAGLY